MCEVCVIPFPLLFLCFYVAKPPRINSHPQDLKDAVPGEPVMFTTEATGTKPLNYQWEWKPATDDNKWHLCDVERFTGAGSSSLTIPRVQKSIEGSYHCIVSNYAGSQTSNPAKLYVGKDLYYYVIITVSCTT